MPKRSISDEEIALIKAMLARGMKNRDIQFFFNRPQRAVNTGRISTIRSETYSNSAAIKAAHAAELDTFIARFANNAGSNQVNAIGVSTAQSLTAAARALFTKGTDGRWHLSNGESQEHECKQEFDPKKLSPIVRAIAALANNSGGYIFFGISNKEFSVEGINAVFIETDILDDFLHQCAVERPLEYIRATLAQSKLWLPIFYFAQMSKLPNEKIAADIRELKISQKRKKKILMDRLEGKRSALTKAVTQSSRRIAADLAKGELIPPSSAEEVSAFAYALTALTGTTLPLQTLLAALITSRELAEVADNANALGAVYKAACRVDEMFFNK
jgi:hypothetical protein